MKNTIASIGLILLSTVVIAIFAGAERASSESEDVLAAEHTCAKALVDADLATLDRCIADDYVEMIAEPVSDGGAANWRTQSKKEWLDLVRSRREILPPSSPSTRRRPRRMVNSTRMLVPKSIRGKKGTGVGS